ncbi:MAG: coproporphyrinogen dehydrogenase HemZ [Christensenellales bacterium]
MIYLATKPKDFFHDADEMLRMVLGDIKVMAAKGAQDAGGALFFDVSVLRQGESVLAVAELYQDGRKLDSEQAGGPVRARTRMAYMKYARRLMKIALFHLLRRRYPHIGVPWGSLTGIRPTKLVYEMMGEGMDRAAVRRTLTDIYDVREDKAQLLLDIVDNQAPVRSGGFDPAIDVYIGIPFCRTRCVYCSFFSSDIGKDRAYVTAYLDALEKETASMAHQMRAAGRSVRSLYIGGGTPTALDEAGLERVLVMAQDFLPDSGEFTLEAGRPDTITREKLRLAGRYGVTRLTVNPQTMHEKTLQVIGRKHTAREVVEAFHMAREEGFGWINMDLIAGLPGEDFDMFAHSLEQVTALEPENITVHTLAVKRSSKLHENPEKYARAEAAEAERMVSHAQRILPAYGWKPYYLYRQKYMSGNLENVGYAKGGAVSRYNIDVMEETHCNLAMGAGGITKWYYPEKNRLERTPNVKDVRHYIARIDEMIRRKKGLIVPL